MLSWGNDDSTCATDHVGLAFGVFMMMDGETHYHGHISMGEAAVALDMLVDQLRAKILADAADA